MTVPAPTWGEIQGFLKIDGWRPLSGRERGGSRKRHTFWEKVLPDGRVLQTHVSHSADKGPAPRAFALILSTQLEVSREAFWAALQGGEPVDRPVPVDEDEAVEHEAWVVEVLANDLRLSSEAIQGLSVEAAKQRVTDHWSRPRE